jgi:hypothetical protein
MKKVNSNSNLNSNSDFEDVRMAFAFWKKISGFHPNHSDMPLPSGLHIRLLPHSIRGAFRAFCRSSQSSKRSVLEFCGEATAVVSKRMNFTADATGTQTL